MGIIVNSNEVLHNMTEADGALRVCAGAFIMENVWEKVTAEPMNVVLLNGEKVGK